MLQVLSAVEEPPAATLLAVFIPNLVLHSHLSHSCRSQFPILKRCAKKLSPPSRYHLLKPIAVLQHQNNHHVIVYKSSLLKRKWVSWVVSNVNVDVLRSSLKSTHRTKRVARRGHLSTDADADADVFDAEAYTDHIQGVCVAGSWLDSVQSHRSCWCWVCHWGGQQKTLKVKTHLWRWYM